jgi:hypothetical protein
MNTGDCLNTVTPSQRNSKINKQLSYEVESFNDFIHDSDKTSQTKLARAQIQQDLRESDGYFDKILQSQHKLFDELREIELDKSDMEFE